MTEAYLYEPYREKEVKCNLCRHRCIIKPAARGICGVRENRNGKLISRVYGRVIAANIDPIEKKPLFHVMPGSLSFSVATVGCNFKCRFCQNADIAQMPADRDGFITGKSATPEAIVDHALGANCKSISYTYTEPTVYFEFAYDTARLAAEKGIKNVFVTNGYMSPEALRMAAPFLDGANVDLKAFSDDFYKTYCGARLAPVKDTLKLMKELGIFVEITTLLIPGLNDDEKELAELAAFIRDELGPQTPWHVSRFHPTYRLTDRPPTPVETILKAREIGTKAGLRYVYVGNVRDENGENTFCHSCGLLLIARRGFTVEKNVIQNNRCPQCRAVIDGIGMSG
jgi:pyruvate formate lyase activating enzyme